jgi:ABC-type iron transport system FetAB ATPase subunit
MVVEMQQDCLAPQPGSPRLWLRDLKSALAGPFDLELAAGACLAISGPSGSGKSLFLRMIADLDPNEGAVALEGVRREAMSGPAWRRKSPYVAAESGWWRDTVQEHFAPGDLAAARELAARLGVRADAFESDVASLSTGERQRLALIRALVLDPPLLLLDEPTGPLDPDAGARVEAVLAERLRAGTAVILVSHDPHQAARLGALRRFMRDRRLEAG